MKRLLLPLLAALALPTAVNAELVEIVNDGKNRQTMLKEDIYRRGDWIYSAIYSTTYKGEKVSNDYLILKINCKRRILEFRWRALTLKRKENGLWEENWKKFSRHNYKEPKQFELPGWPTSDIIFQEAAEGVYNILCKK